MSAPLPRPDRSAPPEAAVLSLEVRAGSALLQAVVRLGDRSHRLLLRWPDGRPRWDCSCGDSECGAGLAALAAAARPAGDPGTAAPPAGPVTEAPVAPARLFYLLRVRSGRPEVVLKVGVAPMADLPKITIDRALATPPPRFVAQEDREILMALRREGGKLDEALLQAMVRSGRTHFRDLGGEPLVPGPEHPVEPSWVRGPDGTQRLVLTLASDDTLLLDDPPLAVTGGARLSRLDPGLSAAGWTMLREDTALTAMADVWSAVPAADRSRIPAPFLAERTTAASIDPVPTFRLAVRDGEATGTLSFRYGTTDVPPATVADPVIVPDDGTALRVARAWAAEAAALGRLRRSRWEGGPACWRLPGGLPTLAHYLLEHGPALEAAGWRLDRDPSCPQVALLGEDVLVLTLEADGSRLTERDGRIDLLRPRGRPVRWQDRLLVDTGDGRVVGIPEALVRDVRLALGNQPHPTRAQALALSVPVRSGAGAPDLTTLPELAPPRVPTQLRAELRPYQLDGLAWLQRLDAAGLGALLADDMGLGKTIQTLAFLAELRERQPDGPPSLVVAPLSLLSNWREEAARFTPGLRTMLFHGAERDPSRFGRTDLVLTTYGLVRMDAERLADRTWRCVILDEAQAIKNPDSRTARAARALDAHFRLCLSGTPMENHLGELWSLFAYAEPTLLGTRASFETRFRKPIEAGSDERRAALVRRIRPFVLRRTRSQVLGELPPLIESERRIELGEDQRRLYESLRASAVADLDALGDADDFTRRARVLQIITRLRQACCAPELLPEGFPMRDAPSAKLEALDAMIDELMTEDRVVLVFSQFTGLLDAVRRRLEERATASLLLTGQTRDRKAVIDRFMDGATDVFLISLKAGGAGLNLTRADTVILLDPWWNPAVEQQAAARAHRMGQTRTVFVYRLIAADTIEEDMQQLKAGKRALNDALARAMEGIALSENDLLDDVVA